MPACSSPDSLEPQPLTARPKHTSPHSSFDTSEHQQRSGFFWSSLVGGKLRNSRADYDDDEHHHIVVGEVGEGEDSEVLVTYPVRLKLQGRSRTPTPTMVMKTLAKVLNWEERGGDFEWRSGVFSLGRFKTWDDELASEFLLTSSNPNLENGEDGPEKMESLSTDDYEIGHESMIIDINCI